MKTNVTAVQKELKPANVLVDLIMQTLPAMTSTEKNAVSISGAIKPVNALKTN